MISRVSSSKIKIIMNKFNKQLSFLIQRKKMFSILWVLNIWAWPLLQWKLKLIDSSENRIGNVSRLELEILHLFSSICCVESFVKFAKLSFRQKSPFSSCTIISFPAVQMCRQKVTEKSNLFLSHFSLKCLPLFSSLKGLIWKSF